MTGNARLWLIAVLASLALHIGAFAAAVFLMPDGGRGTRAPTEISVVAMPALRGVPRQVEAPHLESSISAASLEGIAAALPLPPPTPAERMAPAEPRRIGAAPVERLVAGIADAERLAEVADHAVAPVGSNSMRARGSAAERLEPAPPWSLEPTSASTPVRNMAIHPVEPSPPPPFRPISPSSHAAPPSLPLAATAVEPALPEAVAAAESAAIEIADAAAPDSVRAPVLPENEAASIAPTEAIVSTPDAQDRPARIGASSRTSVARLESPRAPRPPTPRAQPPTSSGAPPVRAPVLQTAPAAPGEVAMLAPANPLKLVPDSGAENYVKALRFLAGYSGGSCFLVLPSQRPDGMFGIDGFALDNARLGSFLADFRNSTHLDAAAESGTVAQAQCRALSFARSLPAYPAFSLSFELERRTVASGENLSGRIRNVAGRPLHLLLVDDEGKVQSVADFLTPEASGASFSAPMTLTSGPVSTVQLLIALASSDRLKTVARLDGAQADDFFNALTEELARRNLAVDIAIASFSVYQR